MPIYISKKIIEMMKKNKLSIKNAKMLILGITFKENCRDIRNTRVVDLVVALKDYNCHVDIYDPWVDKDEAMNEFHIKLIDKPTQGKYDAVLMAVAHNEFKKYNFTIN